MVVKCRACGTENPAGTQFCVRCARSLDEATQQAVVQRRAEHSASGVAWGRVLLAIALTIIVVVLLVFLAVHLL